MPFSNGQISLSNTFNDWRVRTNELISFVTNQVLAVDTVVTGNLTINGSTLLYGTLFVNSAVTVNSTLLVQGATTLNAAVTVAGATIVNGLFTANASAVVNGTLATGNVTVTGFANISTTLNVAGISQHTGNATFSGFINGASTLQIAGLTTLTGNATLSGFANIAATLQVAGTTLHNGVTTVNAAAVVNGDLTIKSTLTANGGVGTSGFVLTSAGAGANAFWASTGGKPFIVWGARANETASANVAVLDTRNNQSVLVFDPSTGSDAYFQGFVSPTYAGNGVTIHIVWAPTTGNTGNVVWNASIERHQNGIDDITVDSFAGAQGSNIKITGATSTFQYATIPFTSGAQMDNLAAGESFRLKLTRLAADANDTYTANAHVVRVVFRES